VTPRQKLVNTIRNEPLSFVEMCFRTLRPQARFLLNWHIEAIVHELEKARVGHTKRAILNVQPRSLKSMIASVAWPAYILGHNPSARVMCVSYGQPLAGDLARDFRHVVESARYKRVFPNTVFNKMTEEVMETTLGGERRSISLEGSITGFGGDYIIIDDPMKPLDAMSR
jgi:hypothetical protein